jgi:hypothetical protein
VARKAKDAPPWTRRKLRPYREAQQKVRDEQRKAEKELAKELAATGAGIDRSLRGTRGEF